MHRNIAGVVMVVCLLVTACARQEEGAETLAAAEQAVETEPAAQESTQASDAVTVAEHHEPPQLSITDLREGSGPAIEPGKTAVVHYTGWLYSENAPDKKGTKFDSSVDRGQPFEFELGAGNVIAGWEQGVAGMQVGDQRRLIIPPHLAYGDRGAGSVIPPGSTLVFDIELLGIR